MADYSYAQLSQMQLEAAERVKEMRRRAKSAVRESVGQSDAAPDRNPSAQAPQCEKGANCSAGKECPRCSCHVRKQEQQSASLSGMSVHAEDADKALLLSLCFLLQAEKADEELILAMLYILT